MPVYLYCVVTAGAAAPPSDIRGLDGACVRAVAAEGVAAWVSDLPDAPWAPIPATPARARAHDAVVRAAMAAETPVPARFGQRFADDEALRASLHPRHGDLVEALARVRGAVEMTVRVLLTPGGSAAEPAPAPESPGRAYLAAARTRVRREAASRREAEILQGRIATAVAPLVRGEVLAPGRASSETLSLSHLISRDAVGTYRAAVRALRDSDPALRLLVTGPWAPYTFVTLPHV